MSAPLALSQDEIATVLAILKAHLPEGTLVHAFGSRATGRCKPWSDLDLVIEGAEALPLSLLAALAEAFAESELPWKVDLVDRRGVSEEFARIIDRTKVSLE